MSEVHYQPRVGSVCYRVFEQIEANGPMVERELAVAVDVDVSTLRSSTNLACNSRAMTREAKGGELWYSSTRVRPQPEAAEKAVAETPPSASEPDPQPAALTIPVLRLPEADPPAARADETPAQIINVLTADKPPGAEVQAIVDDALQHVAKTIGDAMRPGTIFPTVTAEDDVPVRVELERRFEFALWSDGRLSLEFGDVGQTLSVAETRRLLDYLDRMRVEEEPARD